MSEDYLWDRSGPPDPVVEALEQTLAPLRYRHRAEIARGGRPRTRAWWVAVAAAVLAAAALSQLGAPLAPLTAWQVSGVKGQAQLAGRDAALDMPLRQGQVLRTGSASQLSLESDAIGQIDLGPDSTLRATTNRRVMLQSGLLHAYIWAPPREFVVDTPSARAVDLGCEYTLTVKPSGDGLLRVSLGWVAFQLAGYEAFIPAGAECVTHRREGPGIPVYEDAPETLRQAVSAFEGGDSTAPGRILSSARPRDGLTLWHLLTRVPPQDRGMVFDRFAQLVALPPEVSREGVVRKDAHAIDLCWNALDLENTDWWRGWERRW